jgi:hypothetical protein
MLGDPIRPPHVTHPIQYKTIDVIWSFQNAARIDKPYIILNYTNDDIPDHEYYGDVDVPGYRKLSSWRKAIVDMQFYCGPDSMKIANRVAMLFATELVLQKETELNVSIGSRLFFSRMPAMINTSQFEERAIYQFEFLYTEEIEEWVSWIEAVEIHGTYSGSLTELTCDEIADLNIITQWDDYTTPWDRGKTVWDYE